MIRKVNTQELRHEKLFDFMKLNPGCSRILDVGCGNGWFLERISQNMSGELYGCDCVKNLAFDDFEFSLVNLNEQNLPYQDGKFDVIVCSDVLEHLENPSKCIRELRRVIKPAGLVFITIPNVANVLQRLYFLVYGNSKRFNPKSNEVTPHISMLPSWVFRYLIKQIRNSANRWRWLCFPFQVI